jgi:hypothetical protein
MRRLGLILVVAVLETGALPRADVWDTSAHNDDSMESKNELTHGLSQDHDLAARGGVADKDFFRIVTQPESSYEAIIDGQTGDISLESLRFVLTDSDGTTVLDESQNANGTGVGYARTLTWESSDTPHTNFIVVGPGACGNGCTEADRYRIRFYDTTIAVPRFNNTGSQVTLLFIQNAGNAELDNANLTVRLWDANGELRGSEKYEIRGKQVLRVDTSRLIGASGSGSITITNTARYGWLNVKAVALEPSTGFSFDTPGVYKPL